MCRVLLKVACNVEIRVQIIVKIVFRVFVGKNLIGVLIWMCFFAYAP